MKEHESIRTVAVIGAGSAGRGFAMECAAAGFHVVLEDVMPANLRRAKEEYAERAAAQPTRGNVEFASTIEAAVRNADLVVDFVPDELESKLEIFCLLDRMAPPRTAILTPSEKMSITDLASCTYRGERCFAMRGVLRQEDSRAVRLLHPPTSAPSILASVTAVLRALNRDVLVEQDVDVPMLTKNAR